MKRILLTVPLLAAVVTLIAIGPFGGDDGYLVRAYFDNGSFVVNDEDVRVAGANVGKVEEVDVSLRDEVVSEEPGREVRPGKAAIVMSIGDPAFQDFRADASCLIRQQSLIGERFIDCRPTMPRADAGDAPPPLEEIPDGQPGAGQLLLPLENNGKTVDFDLLNNMNRRPYADRFRLILNELGIGLAARGEDLAEIVERANPTLREGNKVLEILASQSDRLARLAESSDRILQPLARERSSLTGFFRNASVPAEVTAERRPDLELALQRFPEFLREFEATLRDLRGFSEAALPVTEELGRAAPSLTEATEALEPFSEASTTALSSLGDAAEDAGPPLAASDPIIRRARDLAQGGVRPTGNLKRFLGSVKDERGFESLMSLIYNYGGSMNGFDQYGHFMRSLLVPKDCVSYRVRFDFLCGATFPGRIGQSSRSASGTADSGRARAAGEGRGGAAQDLVDFLIRP